MEALGFGHWLTKSWHWEGGKSEGLGLGHWLVKSWHREGGESDTVLDCTKENFEAAGAKSSRLGANSPSVGD